MQYLTEGTICALDGWYSGVENAWYEIECQLCALYYKLVDILKGTTITKRSQVGKGESGA